MNSIALALTNDSNGTFTKVPNGEKTEQRTEKRHSIHNPVSMAFYNSGELFRGSIINLSSEGACLLLYTDLSTRIPVLGENYKIECYIVTPKGRSKCRGVVRWTRQHENWLRWGISFIELSPHAIDPFRVIIDEMCRDSETPPTTEMA